MKVNDLTPGERVIDPRGGSNIFLAKTDHPYYKGLALVIWRLQDGTWSHDALDWRQEVGSTIGQTPQEYRQSVREALFGSKL